MKAGLWVFGAKSNYVIMKKIVLLLIAVVIGSGCVSTQPPSADEVPKVVKSRQPDESNRLYSVFLVGDAGDASLDPLEPSLAVLQKRLEATDKNSAVLFLGDNLYPDGLPAVTHRTRERAEKRMRAQFKSIENHKGRVVFLAGNHDWASSGQDGLEAVKRQEQFVERELERGNVFLPGGGMPGPAVVKVGNEETFSMNIVVLDTQWWLHPYEKPRAQNRQQLEATKARVLQNLTTAVTDTTVEQVLVAGHHPMYSFGVNGGYFPLKTHLLPPVGGSLYVLYRNIWGTDQDISSYDELKEKLTSIFTERNQLIYASGHDHNLQYIFFDDERSYQHYIVSGAATRTSYAKSADAPNFAIQQRGFSVVHYYKNSIWVEFWSESGERIYEAEIAISP